MPNHIIRKQSTTHHHLGAHSPQPLSPCSGTILPSFPPQTAAVAERTLHLWDTVKHGLSWAGCGDPPASLPLLAQNVNEEEPWVPCHRARSSRHHGSVHDKPIAPVCALWSGTQTRARMSGVGKSSRTEDSCPVLEHSALQNLLSPDQPGHLLLHCWTA